MAAAALLSADDKDARIEALIAENERLRDQVEILEAEKNGVGLIPPMEWELTGKEAAVFACLMAREVCSRESLLNALYSDRAGDPPELKIIDVFVCKLRRKIEPYGVLIETMWARGYYLPPASKKLASELIAASPNCGQAR